MGKTSDVSKPLELPAMGKKRIGAIWKWGKMTFTSEHKFEILYPIWDTVTIAVPMFWYREWYYLSRGADLVDKLMVGLVWHRLRGLPEDVLSAPLEYAVIYEIELDSRPLPVHDEQDVVSFHDLVVPALPPIPLPC